MILNGSRWLLMILFLAAIFWFFFRENSEPVVNQSVDPSRVPELRLEPQLKGKTIPTVKAVGPIEPKTLPKVSKVEERTANESYARQQKWVMAKIVNGMAIAQSDMILGYIDEKSAEEAENLKIARVEPNKSKLWSKNSIAVSIDNSLRDPDRVIAALDYFNTHTPVKFFFLEEVPAGSKPAGHLVFQRDEEVCASFLGFQGSAQPIFVNDECTTSGVIHEIMHALGFVHEQSREDRDRYIEVLWDKIDESKYDQFAILPDSLIHGYTGSVFNFDYRSRMLYPPTAFAKDGQSQTMRSKSADPIDPVNEGLSPRDLERLNFLYGQ